MHEDRYFFWDGVPNIKPDGNLNLRNLYLDWLPDKEIPFGTGPAAPAQVQRSEPAIAGVNVLATRIGIKILSVDEWFVPVTDLLAIKLQLLEPQLIKSLMIRIYTCAANRSAASAAAAAAPPPISPNDSQLVYQIYFDGPEIARFPQNDISKDETRAVKNKRKLWRQTENEEHVRCLTHCHIEAWVSMERNAFNECNKTTQPDKKEVHDPTDPSAIKIGVNQSLAGCELIEDIMDGRKQLKVFDYEPADLVYGKERPIASGGQRTFSQFRSMMRRTMYEVCVHSKIGMALLEQVADGQHPVHLYPVAVLRGDVGGTAVNKTKGYYHDQNYEELVQKVIGLIRDAPQSSKKKEFLAGISGGKTASVLDTLKADSPALRAFLDYWKNQWETPAVVPVAPVAATVGTAAAAAGPVPPPGSTGAPPTPPAPGAMPKTAPPGPPGGPAGSPKGPPIAGVAGRAAAVARPPVPSPVAVEFLVRRALLRDMGASDGTGCESHFYFNVSYLIQKFEEGEYDCRYHEPEGQTSVTLNGHVWDVVQAAIYWHDGHSVNIETPLFDAFLHEMVHARRFQLGRSAEYDVIKSGAAATQPPDGSFMQKLGELSNATLTNNVIDRYNGHNREEYDTVEGIGVPVKVNGAVINVNENTIRTELGLPLRRRYVAEETARNTPVSSIPVADLLKRKFRRTSPAPPPPAASGMPALDPAVLAAAKQVGNALMSSLGVTKVVPEMVANQTYFVPDRDHLALALYFNYTMKSANENRAFWQGIVSELTTARAAVTAAAPGIGAELNTIFDDTTTDLRIRALRLLQQLYKCSEGELAAVRGHSPNLQSAYSSGDVDAFAAYVMEPTKMQIKAEHADIGIARDPSETFSTQVAAYLNPKYSKEVAKKYWYHTLIHEPMHILSAWGGFNTWRFETGTRSMNYRIVAKCDLPELQPTAGLGDMLPVKEFLENFTEVDDKLEKELGVSNYQRYKSAALTRSASATPLMNIENYSADDEKLTKEGFDQPDTQATERQKRGRTAINSINDMIREWKTGKLLYTKLPSTTADDFAKRFKAHKHFPVRVDDGEGGDAFEIHHVAWADKTKLSSAMDEGTTEVFARIIVYQLNERMNREVAAVPPHTGIPYYEYCAHLVCQIVRDLKQAGEPALPLLAQAFFHNQWQPFNQALERLRQSLRFGQRYTLGFWEAASWLRISNDMCFTGDPLNKGIKPLREKYAVQWLDPVELQRAVANGTYHDPVCCRYTRDPDGNVTYEWDPLVPSLKAICCRLYPSPVITAPISVPVGLECPNCQAVLQIPGTEILKQSH